jgi:hypothetical protein
LSKRDFECDEKKIDLLFYIKIKYTIIKYISIKQLKMTEKFECSFCGENIKKEDAIEIHDHIGEFCCPDCLYNNLCNECDNVIQHGNIIWNDNEDCYLCEDCYYEKENKTDEESIIDE